MANQDASHAEPHHASARTYVIVGVVLMGLALATYLLGEGRLPRAWSLPVAMLIAFVKAGLVLMYFMHLGESRGAVRLTAVVALLFLVLLIGFSIIDAGTRFPPSTPQVAPFGMVKPAPPPAGHEGAAHGKSH